MPFLHALFVFSKTPSEFMNYIARKSQEYLRKKRARKKINRVEKNQLGVNFGPQLYVGLLKIGAHYLLIF